MGREPCTATSLLESADVIPLLSSKLIHEGQGKNLAFTI